MKELSEDMKRLRAGHDKAWLAAADYALLARLGWSEDTKAIDALAMAQGATKELALASLREAWDGKP